jgi:hypothetical protein
MDTPNNQEMAESLAVPVNIGHIEVIRPDRETWDTPTNAQKLLQEKYGIVVPFCTMGRWRERGVIETGPGDASCSYTVGINSTIVHAISWWQKKDL